MQVQSEAQRPVRCGRFHGKPRRQVVQRGQGGLRSRSEGRWRGMERSDWHYQNARQLCEDLRALVERISRERQDVQMAGGTADANNLGESSFRRNE